MKAISYFETLRAWMRYNAYLAARVPHRQRGYRIDLCRHPVMSRMEGTGRRWSIKGAESTLLLRSVYTSNDWDDYWRAHRKLERRTAISIFFCRNSLKRTSIRPKKQHKSLNEKRLHSINFLHLFLAAHPQLDTLFPFGYAHVSGQHYWRNITWESHRIPEG